MAIENLLSVDWTTVSENGKIQVNASRMTFPSVDRDEDERHYLALPVGYFAGDINRPNMFTFAVTAEINLANGMAFTIADKVGNAGVLNGAGPGAKIFTLFSDTVGSPCRCIIILRDNGVLKGYSSYVQFAFDTEHYYSWIRVGTTYILDMYKVSDDTLVASMSFTAPIGSDYPMHVVQGSSYDIGLSNNEASWYFENIDVGREFKSRSKQARPLAVKQGFRSVGSNHARNFTKGGFR